MFLIVLTLIYGDVIDYPYPYLNAGLVIPS